MKQINVGPDKIAVPALIQGCMRIDNMSVTDLLKLIETDIDLGINFFDHAECYANTYCEELFGKALAKKKGLRDKIILQTKSGIVKDPEGTYYDASKDYIIKSVHESLKRLGTDRIDYYLLHRPDALMEPEEVAAAYDHLHTEGAVLHFGVSNQNPAQMELLKRYMKLPLEINQLQLSIMSSGMVDTGINVNTKFDGAVVRDSNVLDYCRLIGCTIQAWSPFQYGFFEGVFLDNPKFPEVNKVINKIAKSHKVTNSAIAIAWILRHPAKMQAIIGSTNTKRIKSTVLGADIELTRKEWYQIYVAAGNSLP